MGVVAFTSALPLASSSLPRIRPLGLGLGDELTVLERAEDPVERASGDAPDCQVIQGQASGARLSTSRTGSARSTLVTTDPSASTFRDPLFRDTEH